VVVGASNTHQDQRKHMSREHTYMCIINGFLLKKQMSLFTYWLFNGGDVCVDQYFPCQNNQ
jgi:hypothetical protein